MIDYKEFYFAGLFLLNILAFILMGMDKSRAKKRQFRIPEKMLLIVGTICGGIGGIAGMKIFRHKTKHFYFYGWYLAGLLAWGFIFYYRLH